MQSYKENKSMDRYQSHTKVWLKKVIIIQKTTEWLRKKKKRNSIK